MANVKSKEKPSKKILLVDDDDVLRERLKRACADRGYLVQDAGCYTDALQKADDFHPELALIDLRMPGESGLELISSLKQKLPHIKIVVLTGYGSIATALEAVNRGAFNYITKPADADKILLAFEEQPKGNQTFSVPSLEDVEWDHINRIVNDCAGNISKASKLLGIHRRSLQRKLAKKT